MLVMKFKTGQWTSVVAAQLPGWILSEVLFSWLCWHFWLDLMLGFPTSAWHNNITSVHDPCHSHNFSPKKALIKHVQCSDHSQNWKWCECNSFGSAVTHQEREIGCIAIGDNHEMDRGTHFLLHFHQNCHKTANWAMMFAGKLPVDCPDVPGPIFWLSKRPQMSKATFTNLWHHVPTQMIKQCCLGSLMGSSHWPLHFMDEVSDPFPNQSQRSCLNGKNWSPSTNLTKEIATCPGP